jgi:gluconolactonase
MSVALAPAAAPDRPRAAAARRAQAPSPFIATDPAFAAVLGDHPSLVRVATVAAHEGPVYAPAEDALYFTTVPRRRGGADPVVAIGRIQLDGPSLRRRPGDVTVVSPEANAANGMTLAPDGRLVVCEQGGMRRPARISLLDPRTRATETLVDSFAGAPLNSPNDVVVRTDGTVWFTDPTYGHLQGFRPAPRLGEHVYRLDPRTGSLAVVANGFDKPNGLAFSPDGRTLYVGDSGAIHGPGDYDPLRQRLVLSFAVGDEGLTGVPAYAAGPIPGFPDGVTTDDAGRLYVSCAHGVRVYATSGRLLGEIQLPGAVNFTFGGPGRNVLFITADTAVWAAVLAAKGA